MLLLPELQSSAINISIALLCGALIGTERQARKRTAGLRTNALVAIGAAAFVIFASRFPGEASPTRVAAQVVSGIGFLGAGIIFRDGFNVHGLNTAATLWCSAAVGLMAGTGAWHLAVLLTGFVMFVNVGLRPFVKWLKRKMAAEDLTQREYQVWVRCRGEHEVQSRAHILKAFANCTLAITSLAARPTEIAGVVELETIVAGPVATHGAIDDPIRLLAHDPQHLQVRWQLNEET